ncbi:hypothetical protein DFQ11_10280 [Winogradskyella epiphytica]|uniref:Uncharacterized protein n=1 Tax=Winogradskyella epiphytica TaxID=262005 RepID=A0A2V4WWA0_9FLAO|nr:hypothetical protein [Winogradskyella epiphytica]PYE81506.1 hypothetical protein DFQ11_10280 [Winogradskyella epiphytica]GGW64686.1 hypothetical protein GCM10008085_15870 [Winogradskyella epiphytica]
MVFKRTNVEEQLQLLKRKQQNEIAILNDVRTILEQDDAKDRKIYEALSSDQTSSCNQFKFELLDTKNIFHIDQIKSICIDYRLRFLDTKYFKGELPYEAIIKIKQLEKTHKTDLQGFKIVAPSKLFKLENADDPLLFAPIGNGYYFLIHKWGNDLHPFRKLLMHPFKNIENLAITTLLVSIFVTGLIPDGFFGNQDTSSQAGVIFLFIFNMIGGLVIYYGLATGKNFNHAIWDSKYYKT